ncbi:MAG TPA: superoxide dismutase, Ni [Egibacteraceae bacterium]|nr:superoxide dismutase, Ni [Egibacteraceae bacterium]
MTLVSRLLTLVDRVAPPLEVSAHCDVPCGVYDPEQARIEAESCLKIIEKYHDSDDEIFRARAVGIKEARADVAKHHLYVLWSDYFKPPHVEQYPDLHDVLWQATKQCSAVKHSMDADAARKLLELIDKVDEMFKSTGGLDANRVNGRPGN